MYLLQGSEVNGKLVLPIGDLSISVLVLIAAHSLLAPAARSADWGRGTIETAVVAIFIVMFFYYTDLYAVDRNFSSSERVLRLFIGFGGVCIFAGAITSLSSGLGIRNLHLFDLALIGLGLLVWHQGFALALKNGRPFSRVLIVGTQTIGKYLAEELYRKEYLRMEVIGFIGTRFERVTLTCGNPRASVRIFPWHAILHVVETKDVNRILVAGSDACANFPAQDLVALRLRGIKIEDCHSFAERVLGEIPIVDLQPAWVVLSDGFRRSRWIRFVKRLMDLLLSFIGLLLCIPVLLIAAIAIKLDSGGGPVFYNQERVGLNERPFTLYKLRSMVPDAEKDTGPVWAGVADPRVTRVGRFLRRFRIDELPQLLNVLKGEMSLVGPRPERPFFVSKFKQKVPYYHMRFSVKPGISGWAQIYFAYAATEKDAIEKLQYELYYIKNHSPFLDLQILFETVKVLLLGRGAQ